ncbi:MAG TPA: MFS transporter [Gammaproteobacteria bacterium]|nr:MFS transporter [Gammaproteobacteria bacterium]
MTTIVKAPCDEAVIRAGSAEAPCSKRAAPWVLAATILGSSITFIDSTVVNVALPVLQRELGTDIVGAQWIVEAYSLMLSALILVGGSLGDRLGRKHVFSMGLLLFAIASAGCGMAQTTGQLIAARAVQGMGAAMLVPGSLAIISASFSKEDRGRAIGTWSGFTAISAGIGPVLGGWLVENTTWRWIFFINLPLAAVVLAITWWRVPESRDESAGARVDILGAATATLGLGGVVYGLLESSERGFKDPRVVVSLAAGAVLLVLFIVTERKRGPRAMMPLALFRSPTFAGANLLTLFLYGALGGLMFFLPFNLIQVQGFSATEAGATLLPFVLTMFLLSRWAGGLVQRYGAKLPLVVGPIVASAGFTLFMLPGAAAGSYWTSFFPAVMVMSLGMAASVAPLTTTVMGAIDERHAGIASGINNAVSRTAGLISIAVFGIVMTGAFARNFNARLPSLDLPAETRAALEAQTSRLATITIPDELKGETKQAIKRGIEESFVSGFRVVILIAVALSLMSALFAWLLIEGRALPPNNSIHWQPNCVCR